MFLRASWPAVGISQVGTRWGVQVENRSARTDFASGRCSFCTCTTSLLLFWWGRCLLFPVTINMTKKKISCQGTQNSFEFLCTYSKNKNSSPQHPTQIVVYPQLFCLITCIIISLDILSKIHVRYQQLQDSTPGMAPFQWWNHTGMCFSSKR